MIDDKLKKSKSLPEFYGSNSERARKEKLRLSTSGNPKLKKMKTWYV